MEKRLRFVARLLEGAMLFVTWLGDPFRPTRGLDLLGQGDPDAAAIAERLRAIRAAPALDDGVSFDIAGLRAAPIRDEAEYGGIRIQTTATGADPDRHRLRRRDHGTCDRDRLPGAP